MVKSLLLSAVAFFSLAYLGSNHAESLGIDFENDISWQDALDNAKKDDKLLFIDVYTVWCGPCKMLKKYTFNDENAAIFFNENFVNIAYDAEKNEGKKFTSKYPVRGYPTMLLINSEGEIVDQLVGYVDAKTLINFGKRNLKKN